MKLEQKMSKTVHKNKVLFDADEEEEDNSVSFKNGLGINKNYADRYDKWRGKEELQRCNKKKKKYFFLKNFNSLQIKK